jgi:hypothetical protein
MADALRFENVKFFLISIVLALAVFAVVYAGVLNVSELLLDQYEVEGTWLAWLGQFLAHGVALTICYFLMVPVVIITLSLFSPFISNNIHQRHYAELEINSSVGVFEGLFATLWVLLKYIALYIIASPALLLFGFGYLLFIIIGFFLFRRLLLLDALGGHISLAKVKQYWVVFGEGRYLPATSILFLFSLVPLLSLFVPYVAFCVLVNQSMQDELAEQKA